MSDPRTPIDPVHTGWDLPYESDDTEATINLDDVVLAGEITVIAGKIQVDPSIDPTGVLPVLVLRFGVEPRTGRPIPSVLLALDRERLGSLPGLVKSAVSDALRKVAS